MIRFIIREVFIRILWLFVWLWRNMAAAIRGAFFTPSMETLEKLPKLLIVGGGFGGAEVARRASTAFDVTLVDTKPYFEFTPSILRTLVEPEHVSVIRRFHQTYLRYGQKLRLGFVTEIDPIQNKARVQKLMTVGERVAATASKKSDVAAATASAASTAATGGKIEGNNNQKSKAKQNTKKSAQEAIDGGASRLNNELSAVDSSQNEIIDFDYAILCCGSYYNNPFKHSSRVISGDSDSIASCSTELRYARSILIIGGGLVGVEVAAEVAEAGHWSSENGGRVIVATSSSRLLPRQPEAVAKHCEQWLESRGVEILYNERVETHSVTVKPDSGGAGHREDSVFTSMKGTQIKADVALMCVGIKPNSQWLQASAPQLLDKAGFVKVNKNLQCVEAPHIFAAGDCMSIKEEKLAQSAEIAATVAATNLKRIASANRGNQTSTNECKLQEYKPKDRMMVVSLGKYDGVWMWGDWYFTGFIPSLIKEVVEAKTMMKF